MSRHRSRTDAEPHIDLETVRATLAYMQGDMRSSTRLARVSDALDKVLAEIDALEPGLTAKRPAVTSETVLPFRAFRAKFVPWSAS